MAGKTNYLESWLLNYIFRTAATTAAKINTTGSLYIALLTGAPTDAGANILEVATGAGTNYSRVAVAQLNAAWSSPTPGSPGSSISNAAAIAFPVPASTGWGVITHFAIYDAATGGNMLYWAQLSTPKTVNPNDSAPSFAIGALTITED